MANLPRHWKLIEKRYSSIYFGQQMIPSVRREPVVACFARQDSIGNGNMLTTSVAVLEFRMSNVSKREHPVCSAGERSKYNAA